MIDITILLETLIKLSCVLIVVVLIPCLRKMSKDGDISTAMKISGEIAKIASTVVKAANELDITGDLIKLGQTKAEYALEQMKKELENRGITFNEELLVNYIKAAVTELRVEIANTPAEKVNKNSVEQG